MAIYSGFNPSKMVIFHSYAKLPEGNDWWCTNFYPFGDHYICRSTCHIYIHLLNHCIYSAANPAPIFNLPTSCGYPRLWCPMACSIMVNSPHRFMLRHPDIPLDGPEIIRNLPWVHHGTRIHPRISRNPTCICRFLRFLRFFRFLPHDVRRHHAVHRRRVQPRRAPRHRVRVGRRWCWRGIRFGAG